MDKDSTCFHRPGSDSEAGHHARATIKMIANVISSYFFFLSV